MGRSPVGVAVGGGAADTEDFGCARDGEERWQVVEGSCCWLFRMRHDGGAPLVEWAPVLCLAVRTGVVLCGLLVCGCSMWLLLSVVVGDCGVTNRQTVKTAAQRVDGLLRLTV